MAGNQENEIGADNNGTHNPGTRGPDSLSGRSDPADPDSGQRQQDAGHYTGAPGADQGERPGGIVSAPPESNVGPAGAAQSSRGSAGEGASKEMSAAAGGGRPGTSAAADDAGANASVDAGVTGTSVDQRAEQTPDKPGAADSR